MKSKLPYIILQCYWFFRARFYGHVDGYGMNELYFWNTYMLKLLSVIVQIVTEILVTYCRTSFLIRQVQYDLFGILKGMVYKCCDLKSSWFSEFIDMLWIFAQFRSISALKTSQQGSTFIKFARFSLPSSVTSSPPSRPRVDPVFCNRFPIIPLSAKRRNIFSTLKLPLFVEKQWNWFKTVSWQYLDIYIYIIYHKNSLKTRRNFTALDSVKIT